MLQQTPTVCMTEYSEMNSEYLTIQQAHLQQVFQGLTSPIVVCNFCTLKTVMGGIFLVFQVPIKHLSCPCRNFEIYFYPVTPPSSLTLHLVLLHRDLNFSGFSALFLSLIITNNLKNCHSIQGTALILRPLEIFSPDQLVYNPLHKSAAVSGHEQHSDNVPFCFCFGFMSQCNEHDIKFNFQ